MNAFYSLVVVSVISTCVCENVTENTEDSALNPTFTTEYQWTFINYTWPSEEKYKNAITSKEYIPENVAMAGIKVYKSKFYVAIPRIRDGTPATLGYIPEDSPKKNPLIAPFPDWKSNQLGDCDQLQSVQSMEIDKNGTMWVLDGFRINNRTKCPPKMVIFDLNNGTILHTFTFPEHISLSQGGFLNDIVIDDSDGGFAYITDNSPVDPGLIVYSRKLARSWKFRDSSMFAEDDVSEYSVGGHKFKALAPIDGIALSPPDQNGARKVYYCALSGFNLYSIDTKILKNEGAALDFEGLWKDKVQKIGRKQAQSDGMMVDNEGNLYYGLLPLYGVGKWNVNKPFSRSEILDRNNETMVWTDSFAMDNNGYLYLLANNIHKFFDQDYKLELEDQVKFRILKLFTATKSYLYY